jgi:(E)-4-hydroxy-3-methyl-but-2-enyl pyrophosphate reductase
VAVEILLARDMGFCWGVRRAIDMMEKAAHKRGQIISLGPVVHNPQVVASLGEKGVQVANNLESVDGAPVAITAHGVGPTVLEEAHARGLDVVDTTCPIVTRSQRWARKLAKSGFTVIVYGDADHREVKGVLSWAGTRGLALTEESLDSLPEELLSRVAVISQTTQSPARFAAFVARLLEQHLDRINELRVINTLCGVTANQQTAARELAQEVNLMLVIGGRNSANTRHLVEICQQEGVETHHIETAVELEPDWFDGRKRVGVTAGASTPASAVEAVVQRIQELVEG